MKRSSHHLALVALCAAPLAALGQNPVGEVFASDAAVRGSVVLAAGGTQVLSGSQVAAGASTALLRLSRGGEVRICPGTSVSVATSQSGGEVMLSLNTGSMETHYELSRGSDSVLTPDLRLQLIGPGAFHLAVGATRTGDTCVRSLPGNTAGVIVTELMGDATYQVKPGDEVVFRGGRVSGADRQGAACGCPAPPPVQRAAASPAPEPPKTPAVAVPAADNEVHVQVDAPFVFHGETQETPDYSYAIASLRTRGVGDIGLQLQPVVVPPKKAQHQPKQNTAVATATEEKKKGGFFRKIGSFFGKVFGS